MPDGVASYSRFPKFHRVFWGRDPGTLKSDIVSKKHPQLICSDLRLSNWKFEDWNYGNRPYHCIIVSSHSSQYHRKTGIPNRIASYRRISYQRIVSTCRIIALTAYVDIYIYIYNVYMCIYIYIFMYVSARCRQVPAIHFFGFPGRAPQGSWLRGI